MTVPSQLIEYFFFGIILSLRAGFYHADETRVTVMRQSRQVSLPLWNEFQNNGFYYQITPENKKIRGTFV